MSTMPGVQLKCKICGDVKFKREGNREVCEYCGATYVLSDPGMEAELRTAESFREGAQFEMAESLYRKVVDRYAEYDLSDAYWGLFLCEQRVLFETDAQGERFPSFFGIVSQRAEESAYYKKAIGAASSTDAEKADVYRKLCKKIASAKELYRKIGSSSKPFDIFICFKKSLIGAEGFTKDWKMAYDLYDRLSTSYNVFFSEKTLNDVVVHQYEPNIYYGLYTAKVMLLLCSKTEYLESQWVKNEWSRFYAFGQNPSAGKTIIPIFIDDFAPEQLPAQLQSYQGYRADYNLLEHLGKNLQSILHPVDHEAEAKSMDAKLAEQQASFEKQLEALRREMETKKEEPKAPPAAPTYRNDPVPTYTPSRPEPSFYYDDAMIKAEIKREKKYKQMLVGGIVCLFLCFWVGLGLLIARSYMINKATAAKVKECIAKGGVYRAASNLGDPYVKPKKTRKIRVGWMTFAVIWFITALTLFSNDTGANMIKGVAAFALVHAIMSLVFAFSPKHNPYILNGIIPMKKTKFMALCLTLALLALVLMNVLGGNGSPAYYDSGYPIYY